MGHARIDIGTRKLPQNEDIAYSIGDISRFARTSCMMRTPPVRFAGHEAHHLVVRIHPHGCDRGRDHRRAAIAAKMRCILPGWVSRSMVDLARDHD